MKHGDYTYKHLDTEADVDATLLADYVHARMQLDELEQTRKQLTKFIDRNRKKCEPYVWTNQLGMYVNITEIDDNYLRNLVMYLMRQVRHGRDSSFDDKLEAVRAEARRRNLDLSFSTFTLKSGEKEDNAPIDLNDIPF